MVASKKLIITEIVGGSICVGSDDGQLVNSAIAECLEHDLSVEVSFAGVERLTSAFLNAAFGQLYGEFDEAAVRRNLKIVDAGASDLEILSMVIVRAKRFFAEPEKYLDVAKKVLGEDDG